MRQKKASTKTLLVEIGEKLFGQHGFDGISLREIAVAANQANSNVVQYHFADKDGLLKAILNDRLTIVAAIQGERMAALKTARRAPKPRDLLRTLWIPLLTIMDHEGGHTFCRFLLQYMIQPRLSRQPLFTFGNRKRSELPEQALPAAWITQQLYEHYRNLPRALFARRLAALSMMFLSAVVEYDNAHLRAAQHVPDFDAEPIVDMALGALAASS